MEADPFATTATAVALAAAVAWTMLQTTAKKRMIDLRGTSKRRCPSCGRTYTSRTCNRH